MLWVSQYICITCNVAFMSFFLMHFMLHFALCLTSHHTYIALHFNGLLVHFTWHALLFFYITYYTVFFTLYFTLFFTLYLMLYIYFTFYTIITLCFMLLFPLHFTKHFYTTFYTISAIMLHHYLTIMPISFCIFTLQLCEVEFTVTLLSLLLYS